MTAPAPERFLAAIDATWPAAETLPCGPFRLRRGAGGGKRVSAATREGRFDTSDIAEAEAGMRALQQAPLFMIRAGDDDLDAALAGRGYARVDPVGVLAAPVARLAGLAPEGMGCLHSPEPLAVMREIWAGGGIGPERLAVMARVTGPKRALLARHKDRPAGVGFVARDGEIAMLHALEVAEPWRRQGVARKILGRAAEWAQDSGATWFSVLTTGENLPAQALFSGLGLHPVAYYHYRLWINQGP